MNIQQFRKYLSEKDKKLNAIYREYHPAIKESKFYNPSELWENPLLVTSPRPANMRLANVVFPNRVNLLTTSIFFDRIYVHLHDFTNDYELIINDDLFHQTYQMYPNDFLALVRSQKVIPIFNIGINSYSDYMLEKLLYPIITNELSFFTFEGHALICQIWQVKNRAIPNPKERETWGFLMDLCGAMGIGANLVRPSLDLDLWDRRELIFNALSIDEVSKLFHNANIPLNDFFIATGIDYDSSISVEEYLAAFDEINCEKLYALYTKIDKDSFYTEMEKVNELTRKISNQLDQHHKFQKILSIGAILLIIMLYESLSSIFSGGNLGKTLKHISDKKLERILVNYKTKFHDLFLEKWSKNQYWLQQSDYPEALELVKLSKIIKGN